MTPPARRQVGARAFDLLRLIPSDCFTSEADLAELAQDGGIEVVDGRVTGLRALRSAGAITIRRHKDGYLLYARTPTGEDLLETRTASRNA